jgi:D-beta-D-heptose 7-phosphate kinase/D-beta-D-heptose 1-phosphate adenosyltransferase
MPSPLPTATVLVLGDVMLDRYVAGKVQRISPEAPVPVVAVEREYSSPGGAGHVAASLAGLGCEVTLAGLIGTDAAGDELRERLQAAGIRDEAIVAHRELRTICKTRVLAGSHQQLLRLDVDGRSAAFSDTAAELPARVLPLLGRHDAVVLADYDKGTLPPALLRAVIAECRRLGRPCLVDPKKTDFTLYAGATLLTPNLHETERALGRALSDETALSEAAREWRERLRLDALLITRGAEGMTLADGDGVRHFPARTREVADVTGAGDTVVAVLAACLAQQWNLDEACQLASIAAGLAVSKPGAYVVPRAELERAWQGSSTKLLDWPTARRRLSEARRQGKRIVFTNGCFDLLHAGHLHCLEAARRSGDLLVVGLNSDASVKLNKGDARPIITETHRAALLAGLACVDLVVFFDEPTPEELIRALEPNVLVKGGDYDPATMAGADFVRSRGGEVRVIPLLEGLSTTAILAAGDTRHD